MSLISGSNLSKSYGAETVFVGVSLHVPHQARLGLVGANGAGKSTLLRILAGIDTPDSGKIQRARRLRVGLLPQEVTHSARLRGWLGESIRDIALGAFAQLRAMEEELRQLEHSMADPRQTASAMSRYGELQESFELAGGYGYLAEIERVLRGLGFGEDEFDRHLSSFSGGERTRAMLARLLLEDPDLLILDEPTNHLDIESVAWLESWLASWPGAVIVVSHDRYFLDQVVEGIWDLTPRGLREYRGGYTEFARQKGEYIERSSKVFRRQQEFIAKEQDYIQRNIAGQNTRQAQGRRTRLERFLDEEAVDAIQNRKEAAISFQAEEQTGDWALRSKSLVVGRGERTLFKVPDLRLARGECAAILGPNGVGKSTLLQTLRGELATKSGEVVLGPNVRVGYFAQAHASLDPSLSVLESTLGVRPELKISQARKRLGAYLFSGDQVDQKIAELSGGERGRLALAQLAMAGANLLLLDEPTNHLDLASQEALQAALEAFIGTIILVSHDRYLVRALASQIWAIQPGLEAMEVIEGGYDAYLAWHNSLQSPSEEAGTEAVPAVKPHPSASLQRRLDSLEREIDDLEAKLAQLGAEIEVRAEEPERVRQLGERYAAVEGELHDRLAEWEGLSRRAEGA